MSNPHLEHLEERLVFFTGQIKNHPVISQYWDRLSFVLKGGMAHGTVDQISDIDLTLYCDKEIHGEIAEKCHASGLTGSPTGVFFPLDLQWTGHCNLETFEALAKRMAKCIHYEMWEASFCRPLHDPGDRFASIVAAALKDAYTPEKVEEYIKREYVPGIMNYDSVQNPMRRDHAIDTMLTAASCVRQACRVFYLLDGKPYPNDKWIGHYLQTTSLGAAFADKLTRVARNVTRERGEEWMFRPIMEYEEQAILNEVYTFLIDTLNKRYENPVWVNHWYLDYH